MKRVILPAIILVLAIAAIIGYMVLKNPITNTNTVTNTPVVNTPLPDDQKLIRIFAPAPNSLVTSPVTVSGEARGTWFFEASFPIEILDSQGNVLGTGIAQAQGNWMTEDFVPFSATIQFKATTVPQGLIVFRKDNPSGLPENDASVSVPVRFGNGETMVLNVYLGNELQNPNAQDCNLVFATPRTVPKTDATARAALVQLLAGPTTAEEQQGFFTSLNAGVTIQKLTIENGVAKVDFSQQLEYQVGGSCRVSAIRAQITQTLKQFPTVNDVVISINGRTEDILQP